MQIALFSIWFIEFLAFIALIVGINLKETKVRNSVCICQQHCSAVLTASCAFSPVGCPRCRASSGSSGAMCKRSAT